MKKEYIPGLLLFIVVLLLTLANIAYASGNHHDDDEQGEKGDRGEQGIAGTNGLDGKDGATGLRGKAGLNGSSVTNTTNGTALGIAISQLHFDWGTKSLQGGVGVGSYDGKDAVSIGIGKRVDRLLINGSVGREGNKYGYGLGLNFHF